MILHKTICRMTRGPAKSRVYTYVSIRLPYVCSRTRLCRATGYISVHEHRQSGSWSERAYPRRVSSIMEIYEPGLFDAIHEERIWRDVSRVRVVHEFCCAQIRSIVVASAPKRVVFTSHPLYYIDPSDRRKYPTQANRAK